ncbi:MAG: VOC family protein [Dehalococcoidia bacterium]|nr:VOC family protein [Dehalococcoidia bacterium]
MIRRIDHIGLVAASWEEARAVFFEKMGFDIAGWKGVGEKGVYFPPERTVNYFIQVGEGDTVVEIIVPQDDTSGAARFLAKRGPGLHHIGYAVDSVADEAARLRGNGLRQVDLGEHAAAAFFYPKEAAGVLTELVPYQDPSARIHTARQA